MQEAEARTNLSRRECSAAQDLVLYQLRVYSLATNDVGYLWCKTCRQTQSSNQVEIYNSI
jgi:hypothetical protein